MTKILVVSDSHGYHSNLKRVIKKVQPIDAMFHLGDLQCSFNRLKELVSCPIYAVAGNNDFMSDLPKVDVFQIDGVQFVITHGHRQRVHYGVEEVKDFGICNGGDVVCFGHTHRPYLEQDHQITVLNPGSISLPRQEGHIPTFAIVEIDLKGQLHFTIRELE